MYCTNFAVSIPTPKMYDLTCSSVARVHASTLDQDNSGMKPCACRTFAIPWIDPAYSLDVLQSYFVALAAETKQPYLKPGIA